MATAVTLPESPEFELLSEPKQSHELELYPASDSASMDVDMPSESLAEPPEASQDAASTPEPDDKTKRIQLSADMANDPEVLQTIEDAQMSRAGAFASSDQISALLSQLTANGIVAGLDATAFGGAPGATDGTTMTTPHAPPFGAGPAAGPQVQPPPGQISAEALDALRSYPPEQVAAIVQANPAMAAGLDLAALGLVPGAAAGPQGGFDVPPHMQQRPAYVPPGFAAAQVRFISFALSRVVARSAHAHRLTCLACSRTTGTSHPRRSPRRGALLRPQPTCTAGTSRRRARTATRRARRTGARRRRARCRLRRTAGGCGPRRTRRASTSRAGWDATGGTSARSRMTCEGRAGEGRWEGRRSSLVCACGGACSERRMHVVAAGR